MMTTYLQEERWTPRLRLDFLALVDAGSIARRRWQQQDRDETDPYGYSHGRLSLAKKFNCPHRKEKLLAVTQKGIGPPTVRKF